MFNKNTEENPFEKNPFGESPFDDDELFFEEEMEIMEEEKEDATLKRNIAYVSDMRWSVTSVSSFLNCNYYFALHYIDKLPTADNFFAQFGRVVHEILEDYWHGSILSFQMADAFLKKYQKTVTLPPPGFMKNVNDSYVGKITEYFKTFDRELSDIEMLSSEKAIESTYMGYPIIIIPDFLFKNENGSTVLMDFKTSTPFYKTGTPNKKKMQPYERQLQIYAYFVQKELGIKIDVCKILFPRAEGREYGVNISENKIQESLDWLQNGIEKIMDTDTFEPNTSDKFFCQNLCSQRDNCPFWKEVA